MNFNIKFYNKIYLSVFILCFSFLFSKHALANDSSWMVRFSVGQSSFGDFDEAGLIEIAQLVHGSGIDEEYITQSVSVDDTNSMYSIGVIFKSSIVNVGLSYADFGKLEGSLSQGYDNGCPDEVLGGSTVGCRQYRGNIDFDIEAEPRALELSISKDFAAFKNIIITPKILYVQWDVSTRFNLRDQGVTSNYGLDNAGDIVMIGPESNIDNKITGEDVIKDKDLGLGIELSSGFTENMDLSLGWTRYLDGDGDTDIFRIGVSLKIESI